MKKIVLIIFLMIVLALVGCSKDQKVEVTFDTNGGSAIETITSLTDLLAGIPSTARAGYTFDGWYTDEDLTESFDPLDERDSWELTIYAKWIANAKTYSVEHYQEELNGSFTLIDTDNLEGVTDQVVTLTANTYEGFTYQASHALGVATMTLPATGDAVLKAYYTRNTYIVNLNEAGGTHVTNPLFKYGQTIVLPETTRFGFTFLGWGTYPTTMPAGDLNLTALWEELDQFVVTFDSKGGSTVDAQTIYDGYLATEPTSPTRIGYTFNGWVISGGSSTYLFTTPVTENMTLEARWTPILVNYTTRIYTEALDGSYVLSNTVINQALTESTATAAMPDVLGFTEHTTHQDRIIEGTVLGDGSLILSRYYSRNTYTITFEANANLSIQSIVAKYQANIVAPSNPIRSGYEFMGWYQDSALTTPYVFTTMPAGGTTVYAKWQGLPTTLNFNSNGGTTVTSITAPLGDTIIEPASPTKEGFSFAGWYEDVELTQSFTTWIMPAGGMTLYAKWNANLYTITFEENGGSTVADIIQGYQTAVSAPLSPTKTDYLFAGWYRDLELQQPYTFTTMPLNGLTLYAKWITEEEGMNLGYIATLDPYTEVHVQGTVFMMSIDPYVGFYITDGYANIYVMYDQDLVVLGSSYEMDAILIHQDGLPKLAYVQNVELIVQTYDVITPTPMTMNQMIALSSEQPYAQSIELTGILKQGNLDSIRDLLTGEEVYLSKQFIPTSYADGYDDHVTIKGVIHRYQGSWILGVYEISITPLTSLDRAEMVRDYLDASYPTSFEGMDPFPFITDDPWGFSSISMAFDSLDEPYYDLVNQRFVAVTEVIVMNVNVDMDIDGIIYDHALLFDLQPRLYQTIDDVIDGSDSMIYNLHGTIVMAHPEWGIYVIQDSTGDLYLRGSLDLNYGDEVAVTITRVSQSHMIFGEVADDGYYLLSENNVLNNDAEVKTLHDLSTQDLQDASLYGQFVELRGFLESEMSFYEHGNFVLENETFSIPIQTISYQAYETLFEYMDLEVNLRGYLALNEMGELIFLFAGQRLEVQIPEYTDTERVEMILTLFSREYADHTFVSYENLMLLPYHPVLGGHIEWTFLQGEEYYNQDYQWFNFVTEPKTIQLEMTITHHEATRTYVYQTTLNAPDILTIAEFKSLGAYEYGYVEGIVVYRNPSRLYLQDETGLLLVENYNIDAYAGDHVVLYGQCYQDYNHPANISLYLYKEYGEVGIPIVAGIISRDQTYSIAKHEMTIDAITMMDPDEISSYNQMITTSGYLTWDGWYFNLQIPGHDIEFEAIDEYTMYKLSMWEDQFVTIDLMVEYYNYSGTWEFYYLGIQGDVSSKSYALTEQQEMVKNWIDDLWSTPLQSSTSRALPSTYMPLVASMTYSVPSEYQDDFDVNFGYAYPTAVALSIPLSVTISIGEDDLTYVINLDILPTVSEEGVLTIAESKSHIGEIVTVEATILTTFPYDDYSSGMLLADETGYLIVKFLTYQYFYGGGEIGYLATATGTMTYQEGRYVFEVFKWDYEYGTTPVVVKHDVPVETLATEDHSMDQHLGEYVEVMGTIERVYYGRYDLVSGESRIRLQTVYYGQQELEKYVGFDVKIRGFILGQSTYDEQQVALVLGYTNYGHGMIVELNETDDQVIAEKILAYVLYNRWDEPYYPNERIPLTLYHPLFGDVTIDYTPLNHQELLEDYEYEYLILHTPTDVTIDIEVQVSYGTGLAEGIFTVEVMGYTANTLDDLFDVNVPFDDIYLEAIVMISSFDYAYFWIDGEVYYYAGNLGKYSDPGQQVLLIGKKAIIDGTINYTYNVEAVDKPGYEDMSDIVSRPFELDDVYAIDLVVDDIRRDVINIHGRLGYDPYLNYFYVDDQGLRVYIRHQLREYEPTSYFIQRDGGGSKDQLLMYLDDYVYINVLYPHEWVLADYLLVDFLGGYDDVWTPEHNDLEKVTITAEKIMARYDDMIVRSGEHIELMTYDMIQETEISYSLVDEDIHGLHVSSWEAYAEIVSSLTEIQIQATILYYNDDTSVETSTTITFSIFIEPIEEVSVREVLFGNIGQYYITEGVVQYIFPEYFMIIKDETGLIYVELPGFQYINVAPEVGDMVKVLAMRAHFEYEDYVPVMSQTLDIIIVSSDHTITRTPVVMTIDDILALDYLDPDTFNQFISFTGQVIFSGNIWYPSYDLREIGYANEDYDLQIWGDTYEPFNNTMNPLVGTIIRVEGYLIGFEYIYQAFDWHLKVTSWSTIPSE